MSDTPRHSCGNNGGCPPFGSMQQPNEGNRRELPARLSGLDVLKKAVPSAPDLILLVLLP